LIYVGEKGQLQDFGSTCLFRGYIYIDENNTSTENGFYWGDGSSIDGAFHNFSTKPFKWNYLGTDPNKPTKITYNAVVLAPFNTLKKGYVAGNTPSPPAGPHPPGGPGHPGDGCVTETIRIPHSTGESILSIENGASLNPTPLGYYFY
jgi:hypothetical protein